MPMILTHHAFTHGQLDEALKTRSDLDVYQKGALELKNVVVKAGGSVRSRFGTEFIAQGENWPALGTENKFYGPDTTVINQDGTPVDPDDYGYQLFEFSPSDGVELIIILGQNINPAPTDPGITDRLSFFCVTNKDFKIGTTNTGPEPGTFNTVYSTPLSPFEIDNNQVVRAKYRGAQNQLNFILSTSTHSPVVFTYNPLVQHEYLSGKNAVFLRYPQHDFSNSAYTKSEFMITGAPGTGNIPITPPGTTYTLEISTLDATDPEFKGFYYDGNNALPDERYVLGVFSGLGPLQDTGTGGNAVLATPGVLGRAIIVSIVDNTHALIRVTQPFDLRFRTPVSGDQCILTEKAMSNPGPTPPGPPPIIRQFPGRGWPRVVAFYENRLIYAGTTELPQSLFMSVIGEFQNYDAGTGEANDAINFTIASGEQDQIVNVVSGRSLQVFTTTNEFSAPVWGESGLTPQTVTLRRQTSIGSENCVPSILDNSTMFVKRGGRAAMSFESQDTGGNTYNSVDTSIFSSELMSNPIHMASYIENGAYDSNVLLMINKGEIYGKKKQLVILESLKEQKIMAWTHAETNGNFENVVAAGPDVFFITRRAENANYVYSLEKINWNIVMDAGLFCEASIAGHQQPIRAGATGPAVALPKPYWGKKIKVVGYVGDDPRNPQGVYIDEATVDAAGSVSVNIPQTPSPTPEHPEYPGPISPTNKYYYWLGLGFEQKIQTMPLDLQTTSGNILMLKKKIFVVYIEFMQSYPFFINGVEAMIRNLGTSWPPIAPGITLNVAEKPYSGIIKKPTMQKYNIDQKFYGGWVREATVLITTDRPLPMTIQGISYGVA